MDDARTVLSHAGFASAAIDRLLSKRVEADHPYVENEDLIAAAFAFQRARWSRENAAKALGVGPTTIFTIWKMRPQAPAN